MKRVLLLIMGILWYIATISLIVYFVRTMVKSFSLEMLIISYFLTWLLAVWQSLFVYFTCRLYNASGEIRYGISLLTLISEGQWLAVIIRVLLSPILLIWHLFVTVKPMWWLIRYRAD